MFKIYKRTIQIGTQERLRDLTNGEYPNSDESFMRRRSNILTLPAMIAGAIIGTLVFSIFFVLLLIPLGIVGFRTWRLMKTAQKRNDEQTLTAEYTVISEKDKL